MPDEFSIQFDVRGDPEAYQVVRTGLDTYNLNFIPSVEHTPLNLYVRAHDGTVLGGLLGGTIWGWLYVEILWLAKPPKHNKANVDGSGTAVIVETKLT